MKRYRVTRPGFDVWAETPEQAARIAAQNIRETTDGTYRVHDFPFPGRSWSVVLKDAAATVISGPAGI